MDTPLLLPAPHSPALPTGGAIRIIYWLLLHPQAWRAHLNTFDPPLRANFNLLVLTPAQRRSRKVQTLCIALLLSPVLISIVAAMLFAWAQGFDRHDAAHLVLSAAAFSVSIVAATGLLYNLPAGAVYAAAMGIGIGLIGFDHARGLYTALGASAGLWGAVVYNTSREAAHSRSTRYVRVAVALLFTFGMLILVSIYSFNSALTSNSPERWLGEALSTTAGLYAAAGLAVIISGATLTILWHRLPGRRLHWALSLAVGLTCGLLLLAARLPLPAQGSIPVLAGLFSGLSLSVVAGLFGVLGDRFGGKITASVSTALAAGAIWFSAAPYTVVGFRFEPLRFLSEIALILAGLALPFWFPIAAFPFLALWCYLLYLLDVRYLRSGRLPFLRFHPAFTLGRQLFGWPELARHLLLVAERSPQAVYEYFSVLLRSPFSRSAARAVMIELETRRLERCREMEDITALNTQPTAALTGEEGELLRRFEAVSRDLAAARHRSGRSARLRYDEVLRSLKDLEADLAISADTRRQRFSAIAARWRRMVELHSRILENEAGRSEEIANPYVCGLPLDERQEVFVGRVDLLQRIEQFLLARQTPPLVLYGQRRMGKTSLLLNLRPILNPRLVPVFIDFQGLMGAASYESLYHSIIQICRRTVQERCGLLIPTLAPGDEGDPSALFRKTYDWLDESARLLKERELALVLLLDEFEALDTILTLGRLDPAPVMTLFRHLFRTYNRFSALLAGSHTLNELGNLSPYLVEAQVLKVGVLEPEEALRLVTRPARGFPLRYADGAAEQILSLTGRHPNLIQLVCYQLVDLKNSQPARQRFRVTTADVEAAACQAMQSGAFFFADIARNQIPPAAAELMRSLARCGPGAELSLPDMAGLLSGGIPPEELVRALLKRDLISLTSGGGYSVSIELIRRWFAGEPCAA